MDREYIKSKLENKTLLFIDDDSAICESMNILLKRYFKDIVITTNPQEAVDIFKNKKFDIVITDITMPKLDGLELAKILNTIDENINIIFVTGNSNDNLDVIVKYHLVKPIHHKDLLQMCVDIFS